MRRIVKFVAPLVVFLAAATTAVAMADPVVPTDPYPRVDDLGTGVCAKEVRAVDRVLIRYGLARPPYDRAKEAVARGVGAAAEVDAAEKVLLDLSLELNTAKYALAACRNQEGGAVAKDKKCTALYLEYNRLTDQLAIQRELEKVAQSVLTRARRGNNQGVEGRQVVEAAELAARLATFDREATEEDLAAAAKKIRDDADCKDGSFQRPQQAPPPREVIVPTSAPAEPPTEVTLAPANPPLEGSARISLTFGP